MFWQKDGVDLTFNQSLSKLPDHSIVIKNFSSSHIGNWMVTAHNNVGKLIRRQIILEVKQEELPLKVSITNLAKLFKQKLRIRSIFGHQLRKLLKGRKPTLNVQCLWQITLK